MAFASFSLEAEAFLCGVVFFGDREDLVVPVFPKSSNCGHGPFDDTGCPGVGVQACGFLGGGMERLPFHVAKSPCQ